MPWSSWSGHLAFTQEDAGFESRRHYKFKLMELKNTNELLPGEYPAQFQSTKYDGSFISIFRVSGKYGLVYYTNINANKNDGFYIWKYFSNPIVKKKLK